jgi:predicted GNAT superfamily acetyltransferase
MVIEIRRIQTHDEYRAAEQIQREAWDQKDVDVVPDHLLITAQKNGGLVLGAFERIAPAEAGRPTMVQTKEGGGKLIGFVFSFVGLASDGRVKHCSHIAAVNPTYQNQNVGYRLKLAQREHVLAQGLDLITWTFDPLESRNSYLNFHKLGTTCRTYLRELYGRMRDGLNAGLPSDRFQVDWHIASAHVSGRLRGDQVPPSLSALRAGGVPTVNRSPTSAPPRPPQTVLPLEGDLLLVQIPADFQAIKSTDRGLARAWREHTRALFEAAFAKEYTAIDLLFEEGQSYYLLKKDIKVEVALLHRDAQRRRRDTQRKRL